MKTKQYQVYEFNELTKEAKQYAINKQKARYKMKKCQAHNINLEIDHTYD